MHARLHNLRFTGLLLIAAAAGLAGCSKDGGQASGPLGVDSSALTLASSGSGSGSDSKLEAELNPVIAVDASGKAVSEDADGTAQDRFTSEVEIAKRHFNRLGIDAEDGFQDERVILVIRRDGVEIFRTRLRFSENRPQDITFEADIRGAAAPELQPGDVATVQVNGNRTLRGVFRQV